MVMKRTHLYLAVGGTCLALGAGAGLAGIKGFQSREKETRIAEIMSVFKERCNGAKTEQSCFYEPEALESSARLHLASGDQVQAGLVYSRIMSKLDEARKVAEKCEAAGDMEGAKRIREELSARAIAIERYLEGQAAPAASR
jgi:hypothetical protein